MSVLQKFKKPVALIAAFFMLSIVVSEFVKNCITPDALAGNTLIIVNKNTHANSNQALTRLQTADFTKAITDCKVRCYATVCQGNNKLAYSSLRYVNTLSEEDTQPEYYVLSEKIILYEPDANARTSVKFTSIDYPLSYSQSLKRNHILRI